MLALPLCSIPGNVRHAATPVIGHEYGAFAAKHLAAAAADLAKDYTLTVLSRREPTRRCRRRGRKLLEWLTEKTRHSRCGVTGMCCLSQGVGRHNAQPRQGPVEIVVAATSRPPVISGDLG